MISTRDSTTIVLCITVFFLFADQNLLAPNLSAIANDFGFSDHERDEKLGSNIAIGFFIVGGTMALLVGYFADTVDRVKLFAFIIIFGESAGFATYFVKNYNELFICRVLTGISIGGANPVIFSILGDLYAGSSRIYVSTLIGISQSAGIAFGQFLAGMVGPSLGWRAPFIIIALPAIVCGCFVYWLVEEPTRGSQEKAVRMLREEMSGSNSSSECTKEDDEMSYCGKNGDNYLPLPIEPPLPLSSSTLHQISEKTPQQLLEEHQEVDESILLLTNNNAKHHDEHDDEHNDEHDKDIMNIHYSEKIEISKLFRLFQTLSAVIIFAQGLPGCLPWGMVYVFLNDYLSNDCGLSIQSATGILTCFGVGGLFGQFFGGWMGQRFYNQDVRYPCLLMGISTMISIFPLLYILNNPMNHHHHTNDISLYLVAIVGGLVVNINGPNIRVVLQNICIPEVRGTAFAIFSLADDLGKGMGPALVVLFIQACHGNRQKAFNIVVLFWLVCGVLLLLLVFTVSHDEAVVHETVKQSLLKQLPAQPSQPSPSNDTIDNPLLSTPTSTTPHKTTSLSETILSKHFLSH